MKPHVVTGWQIFGRFSIYPLLIFVRMKCVTLILLVLFSLKSLGQSGEVVGTVLDENKKSLQGANVQLLPFSDSLPKKNTTTDKDGYFQMQNILFGYYRLKVSYVGLKELTIDSVYLRADKFHLNLDDIVLKSKGNNEDLNEVIIYAEKPLIQTKDGNITFNAGESPLSAGSSASELLTNVPLISKDPNGKVLVRGKEPKILIDDKPVELNAQQLQDFLESLPGSSIEKIEVLTNPPPQYANEQGGVINIVTKKGTVGKTGRINVSAGTRGEMSASGNFNYRKQGLSFNINAGISDNRFHGFGNSDRLNLYDSSHFRTANQFANHNRRPNFRANLDYDFNKSNSINVVLQYNQNKFDNENKTEYKNSTKFDSVYRLTTRSIQSVGENYNPYASLSYNWKSKRVGETLRLLASWNYSESNNERDFYQQYLNPDYTLFSDSIQQQLTNNTTAGYNFRLDYNLPITQKTILSTGSFYNISRSHIISHASYLSKADSKWNSLDALNNDFIFHQYVTNFRASVKQLFDKSFSMTLGSSAEETRFQFDLLKNDSVAKNSYGTFLPFANVNKNWNNIYNLSLAYRRSIRRPGINELNPTVDISDPYNIRFGNPVLDPSTSHNFDLVFGRTKNGFFTNLGLGYNLVQNMYSAIRTLRINPTTGLNTDTAQITYINIDDRKEYEISTWSGYTINKKLRVNFSASYTYNHYSEFDKTRNKYRDGGSLTSNLNTNYTLQDIYNITGSFTYNRFANPQGTVSSSVSMNIGLQGKFFYKRLIATINIIDPFQDQQSRTTTYSTYFMQQNYSLTQTRNYRFTLGYNFIKAAGAKKKDQQKKDQLKNLLPSKQQ